jgi:DNA-binding response OmpR family regulator
MAARDRVLIIEDDREIAEVVALTLRDQGLEVERAADGRSGLEKALAGEYALIILDLMLPRLDGLTVCRRIREGNPVTPILMLTARAEEPDRVRGLELGADDYLSKPFGIRELAARVKALLRRARAARQAAGGEQGRVVLGGIELDFDKRKVSLDGRTVELTVKEFELLALFARNPGRTYTRTQLLDLVWGPQFEGYEHTVNSHINRLRAKIEKDPGRPGYLKTVWGVGYRFAEPAELAR